MAIVGWEKKMGTQTSTILMENSNIQNIYTFKNNSATHFQDTNQKETHSIKEWSMPILRLIGEPRSQNNTGIQWHN